MKRVNSTPFGCIDGYLTQLQVHYHVTIQILSLLIFVPHKFKPYNCQRRIGIDRQYTLNYIIRNMKQGTVYCSTLQANLTIVTNSEEINVKGCPTT